ncbi:uncharacterized protein LOC135155980 [Lytechinus pictus]|uniref:uncharacterized protein LOC135155978 n=1 Tax=Lytechinus pictus TaxID=7653 RepID=UPI0030B9AEC0
MVSPRRKIVCFGDSILRNLECNLLTLDPSYDVRVHVYPGANIKSLKNSLRTDNPFFEFGTDFVILHVGTNNLECGLWSLDCQHYYELYQTVKEVFRSATVIFSSILPRWDRQDLYELSLIYNENLRNFAVKLKCLFFNCCEDFNYTDDAFSLDGLHLNHFGKCLFASRLNEYLTKLTTPKPNSDCNSHPRIPKELKLIYPPPRRPKKEAKKWQDTDLDLYIYKRREKYGSQSTYTNSRRKKKKQRKRASITESEDGYFTPKTVARSSKSPFLPPCACKITYRNIKEGRNLYQPSSCPLPGIRKPYVVHKVKRERFRRRQRLAQRKRKRKRRMMASYTTRDLLPSAVKSPGPSAGKEPPSSSGDHATPLPVATDHPPDCREILPESMETSSFTTRNLLQSSAKPSGPSAEKEPLSSSGNWATPLPVATDHPPDCSEIPAESLETSCVSMDCNYIATGSPGQSRGKESLTRSDDHPPPVPFPTDRPPDIHLHKSSHTMVIKGVSVNSCPSPTQFSEVTPPMTTVNILSSIAISNHPPALTEEAVSKPAPRKNQTLLG